MRKTSPDVVWKMFASFGGYDTCASARLLRIPVRCINGDLFPTDVETIRHTIADFDAVVLPHTGHYPMLECPDEFNRRLAEFVAAMEDVLEEYAAEDHPLTCHPNPIPSPYMAIGAQR